MTMIDKDLEAFVAIVEEGTFTKAAQKLRLSIPVVSKRLARLEGKLNLTLIQRTTRHCSVTSVGQSFYQDVIQASEEFRRAEERARCQAGLQLCELRIRAAPALAHRWLPKIIGPFIRKRPDLHIEIDIANGEKDQLTDKINLEIAFVSSDQDRPNVIPLANDKRILCATPRYLEEMGEPQSLEDLEKHRIVASSTQLPWMLSGPAGKYTFRGRSYIPTNSNELPTDLILQGFGIGMPSLWSIADQLNTGELVHVLRDYESGDHQQICVTHHNHKHLSLDVVELIDFLRQSLNRTIEAFEHSRQHRQLSNSMSPIDALRSLSANAQAMGFCHSVNAVERRTS